MPSNHPVPQSRAGSELVARPQYTGGPTPSTERRDDDEALIDVKLAGDLLRFVLNAIGRHKLAVALVFLGFLSAGVLSTIVLPKEYYTETKMLADRI